jgi:putative transposase
LPTGVGDFSPRGRRIKGRFTRSVGGPAARSASRCKPKERAVWQRRLYEHAIREEADLRRHVAYIHYNPVKHGLVDRPVDRPYSSIHDDIARGILPATWGTSASPAELALE